MMKQHISTKLRSSILPTFHVIAKLTFMILIVQCNELRDKFSKSNVVTKACSWKMILKRDFTDSLNSVVTHYEWLNSHWDIPSLSIIKTPILVHFLWKSSWNLLMILCYTHCTNIRFMNIFCQMVILLFWMSLYIIVEIFVGWIHIISEKKTVVNSDWVSWTVRLYNVIRKK